MPTFRDRPLDLVIDVRSKLEFLLGHLDGALNIPVDRLPTGLLERTEVPKNSRILVYCASGGRSAHATALLRQAGYAHVVDGGGLQAAKRDYRAA